MLAARSLRIAPITLAAVVAVASADALVATTPRTPSVTRGDGFVVVVNDRNTVVALSKGRVSRFFLRKALRWDSGALVHPVDLPPGNPAREAFSQCVLGKSVASVRAYWQQQIFSGRTVPPIEKATDAAVLEFVRETPGAIAYVSPSSTLPRGVHSIDVTD